MLGKVGSLYADYLGRLIVLVFRIVFMPPS